MKSFTASFIMALTILGMGSDIALGDGVIAPGAELQTLSKDFAFSEGPASDAEGNVYFTDQPNDRIIKWTVERAML
jgi:gluconolactonase